MSDSAKDDRYLIQEETINTNPLGSFPVRMDGTAVTVTDTETGKTVREFNYDRDKALQEAWSHFESD